MNKNILFYKGFSYRVLRHRGHDDMIVFVDTTDRVTYVTFCGETDCVHYMGGMTAREIIDQILAEANAKTTA